MDSEDLRQRVETALKAATARADELAGLAPDTEPLPDARSPAPATSTDGARQTDLHMEHRGT